MNNRFQVLDGWRGISILLVLAGHLFPIGPKSWAMNASVASSGMVLFFILSGFLIANMLLKDGNISRFLIRRFMRIVPLAWLVLAVTYVLSGATPHQWTSSLLFYANLPPGGLTTATSHFWSLCVEVQFYLSIALLVLVLKKNAFYVVVAACFCVTIFRAYNGVEISIATYYRVDEILAGCILAMIYNFSNANIKNFIGRLNPILLFAVLLCSAHSEFGALNYFRPYIALLLVGSTMYAVERGLIHSVLTGRFLFYIASISYALYVIHGGLRVTWLGEGDTLEKYLKRPLFLLVTFVLAHLSTNYYEKFWINLGKKLTQKKDSQVPSGT